jgi:hypothetical protein
MGGATVPKKLFRAAPPRDLVERILRSCGLSAGFHDLRWFSKDELAVGGAEDWLPELEAYYLPCKASRFLHAGPMDGARMITILRHILRAHQHDLSVQERLYKDQKQSLYQVQPVRSYKDLSGMSLQVDFS